MTTGCAAVLGPAVAGASRAIEKGERYGEQPFASATEHCPELERTGALARRQLLASIDDKVLCAVMCCCSRQHKALALGDRAIGQKPTRKRQNCVSETLDAADRQTGYTSRYKAEVYYNMTEDPPAPFMHRIDGRSTTEKTHGGMWRIYREIPDYQRYDARRPDIVIVKDPTLPPTQENIERIVEMKFAGDPESDSNQYSDYAEIAGSRDQLSVMQEGKGCKCPEDRRKPQPEPVPVPIPVVVPQKQPSRVGDVVETVGWGVAVAVGAVATVALALLPADGPVGEMLAGAETIAAGSQFLRAWNTLFGAGAAAGAAP